MARRSAVVVGGGVAGLALAAALDPRRWGVTVVEERRRRTGDGASLGMWPAAMRALDRLGIGQPVRAEAATVSGGVLLSSTGRVRLRMPAPAPGRAPAMVLIPRPRLLTLLDEAVPTTAARQTGRADDLRAWAGIDLIVGADGVHSTVRRRAWGEAFAARLQPVVAVRGQIPGRPELPCETWGRHSVFGIAERADAGTYWFASFAADPSLTGLPGEAVLALLRRRFAPFHRHVRGVLARADPSGLLVQMLWEAPALAGYHQPAAPRHGVPAPVVLVGDAAHAMMPNLGRGAGESLVDAVVLADELNAGDDVGGAVRRYQTRRYAWTRGIQAASRAVMRLALSVPD